MKIYLTGVLSLFATLHSLTCLSPVKGQDNQNLVEVLQGDDNFSTLVSAVNASGLTEDLIGEGPFTLFAPTNDAFSDISSELLERFTTAPYQPHLQDLLQYHVIFNETIESTDIQDGLEVRALNGQPFEFSVENATSLQVTIQGIIIENTASITAVDEAASNGVVHTIDTVLQPIFFKYTVVDCVVTATTLTELIVMAGLDTTLSNTTDLTIIAPTNDAFKALGNETLDYLKSDDGMDDLVSILKYHVVSQILPTTEILGEPVTVDTLLEGKSLTFDRPLGITVNGADVVWSDVLATNGMGHIITSVLVPDDLSLPESTDDTGGNTTSGHGDTTTDNGTDMDNNMTDPNITMDDNTTDPNGDEPPSSAGVISVATVGTIGLLAICAML